MVECYVATIMYRTPNGIRKEESYFNVDMPKLVKSVVNYAQNLRLRGYNVHGSVIEELDKYWEFDSTQKQGEINEKERQI